VGHLLLLTYRWWCLLHVNSGISYLMYWQTYPVLLYNYTEEWATYYSSLTDDDAFSTLIQVFHTWCTDKPILSYYNHHRTDPTVCLNSNIHQEMWTVQKPYIFLALCFRIKYIFWSVAWEQVLHYKLHNDKWRIEQKKDNKHFGTPDTCRMQRL
jgi:hypothetical protein